MSTEIQGTAGNGAVQKSDPQQTLKAMLERMKPALAAVLPKHVTADRMLKIVLSATARQPKLLECTTTSIVRSVMQAGELGLEVGGLLGEAYLVPYNVKVEDDSGRARWEKQAQCIPGYKGLIKLARQSGQIASIIAVVVYRADKFRVLPAEDRIEHEPDLQGERNEEDIVAVYAIARFREGGQQIDYMTLAEVDKIRARSKSADSGPWVTDFAEMARKTVVRRLCKYLPLSAELAAAIELDSEHEDRERKDIVVSAGAPTPETPSFMIPEVTSDGSLAPEKPKRGSRLASQVRASGGAPAAAQGAQQQPASSQTPSAGVDRPAAPQQTELGVQAQQQPAAQSDERTSTPAQTPTVLPAQPLPVVSPEERQARLAKEIDMLTKWGSAIGVNVVVKLPSGKDIETYTTTMATMRGEIAVVRVKTEDIDGDVPLAWVTRL